MTPTIADKFTDEFIPARTQVGEHKALLSRDAHRLLLSKQRVQLQAIFRRESPRKQDLSGASKRSVVQGAVSSHLLPHSINVRVESEAEVLV